MPITSSMSLIRSYPKGCCPAQTPKCLHSCNVLAGENEMGWDVFSLQYQLGAPLNSIFTPAAQTSYSRLSRLLWLMRRTERSLGTAWHLLKVSALHS